MLSCLTEKFNGFHIARFEAENEVRTLFSPIDIIYDPVKHFKIKINYIFSTNKCLAYRSTYNVDKKGKKIKHDKASQSYYCSNYYIRQDIYDKHINYCSGILGILYNLYTQNLVTFENNLKYKVDLPFVAYCDFEITAPTDSQSPEGTEMLPVSYVINFAFHPDLNFDKIIIERSFGHNLSNLQYVDAATTVQLRTCAIKVIKRNFKQEISEMFAIELKFAGDSIRKIMKN